MIPVRLRAVVSTALFFLSVAIHGIAQQLPLRTYGTNPQPVVCLPILGSALVVLNNRVDVNFNGTQDPGDSPASIQIFGVVSSSVQGPGQNTLGATIASLQLEWASVNMQRSFFDILNGRLFLPIGDQVSMLTITPALPTVPTLVRTTLATISQLLQATQNTISITAGSVSAMSFFSPTNSLFATIRGNGTSAVIEYNLTNNQVVNSYAGGVFAQQTIPFETAQNKRGLLLLNEGNFGSSNATLFLYGLGANATRTPTIIPIGGTGNHLLRAGDSVFVTMNGSHEVHVFDLQQERIVRTIPVGTTGFNGPRESVLSGTTLYVSTFSNDVRRFDIRTGRELSPRFAPGGRPEGMALLNGQLYVTNAFQAGTFTSASSIAQFDLPFVSVRRSLQVASVQCTPNPTTDEALFTIQSAHGSSLRGEHIDIIALTGHTVGVGEWITPHGTTLAARYDARTLPTGQYIARVRTDQGMIHVPFVVMR